ncbi:hypothetical protein E2C01_040019 [Portunus trituberculatus]|uniref:Uncharacterized protein n=1 Tax=Portunus trituberculatus TaxID=210409 RepID=A0A5B7FMG3_PORTR|nr:hypothetical protein [Portunus trituberculatus]
MRGSEPYSYLNFNSLELTISHFRWHNIGTTQLFSVQNADNLPAASDPAVCVISAAWEVTEASRTLPDPRITATTSTASFKVKKGPECLPGDSSPPRYTRRFTRGRRSAGSTRVSYSEGEEAGDGGMVQGEEGATVGEGRQGVGVAKQTILPRQERETIQQARNACLRANSGV